MKRRDMLRLAGGAVAASSLLGLEAFAAESGTNANLEGNYAWTTKKKKVLVIGAHPDDPESACGGTMIKMRTSGYEVVCVYLTKGEAGIPGKSFDEAAKIREEESLKACELMGVRPVFLTQTDSLCEVNKARYTEVKNLLEAEKPDIVFTHWPIDSHADHRVCFTLVYDAWRRLGYNFELYFFEVMTGVQTQLFHPTDWVDITLTYELKKEASYCHMSQKLDDWYTQSHEQMEIFRGLEYRCKRAEAFIHARRDNNYMF